MKGFAKVTRGAISVLMCVLLTPFLTIAGLLIEFYRYQASLETLQETVDVSAYSTLSDYDEYLYSRFGLLAYAQDKDSQEEFRAIFTRNQCILGKNFTVGDPIVKPSLPLTHTSGTGRYSVLQNQVNDFAETTVMTEYLSETINLKDLIKKLSNLGGLGDLASAASNTKDLINKIKDVVNAAEKLEKTLTETIPGKKSAINKHINNISEKIADLYKKILDDKLLDKVDEQNGITLESLVAEKYAGDLVKIYSEFSELKKDVDDFSTEVSDIITDIDGILEKVEKAKKAAKKVKDSYLKLAGKEENEKTEKDAFELVIEKLEKSFDDALKRADNIGLETVSDAVETLLGSISANLPKLNVKKSYFDAPISEKVEGEIEYLLEKLPEEWNKDDRDALEERIKNYYLPNISALQRFDAASLWEDTLKRAVEEANGLFAEGAKNIFKEVFNSLKTTIEELFRMDGFFNPYLDGYLSAESTAGLTISEDSPYQKFMDAISDMFNAASEFTEKFENKGFWDKVAYIVTLEFIADIITTFVKFIDAGIKIIDAIGDLISNTIGKIKRVVGYISGSSETSFYDLMLLSTYIAYNVPNRTNAGVEKVGDKWQSLEVPLNGSALTGYSYNSIVRPKDKLSDADLKKLVLDYTGLDGVVKAFSGLANGSGNDNMFKGAELEYIIAGTKSEIANQIITFMDILFIRMLTNIPAVFGDTNVQTIAASATIASWAVFLAYLILEPLVDTILIANGSDKVPLIKNSCYLTATGIPKLMKALPKGKEGVQSAMEGATSGLKSLGSGLKNLDIGSGFELDYREYCLLIMTVTLLEEQMLNRLANLIQLEAAAYYGDKQKFNINKTYTSLEITVPIELNSMLGIIDFGGNLSADVVRERGY